MHVLLVEDDLQLGAALTRALELQHFDLVWVRRVGDARAHCEYANFDVVVLDLTLPDGEGFTLLEWLRGNGHIVPVLIMTARERLDDRLRGLNGGADDYLIKPFAVPELIARLRAIMRRSAGFAAQEWSIGPLRIDTEQRRVTVDGVPVDLTPTEYRLFETLARHCGRIVPRETLRATVWRSDDEGSDSALDYQIHSVRRKLGANRISTVRGVGFRLETT
jgi:two-component system, OmpR family, response regulator QseB